MYDRLYIEFLYYFNMERDYYECHEVLEEYWLREGKNKWLQSLLQTAVALHHFRNGNINGAIKLFEQALDKCQDSWDGKKGIHDEKLFSEAASYLLKLKNYKERPFPFYDLTIEIIDPTLQTLVNHCIPEGVKEEDKF
ncbi:DUF309 domain-containing protein [Ammoniphilus resinae]|uniref:Metal-dependent hydrolase n=1 Tax=Ammoniphilus resinae TaxID=861532 RepID=A0ABS4GTK6_9BACL|nr:DUF309 domain-containing protein [Ammoniphilus resinae]MBP1933613.1 putative metal-dependent hydrolase [Ammoniphilus resinae]